ncbi:MAG: glycosyltransferase [Bryobacteraceae bacterium]|nr:glycosyltransferase [Bryobacteraceae bacterium]
MKQGTGVLTIVSKNYLAFARTLMASVKDCQPDALRFVVLVDHVTGEFDPDQEDFVVLPSDILDIPNSPWFHFKYSVLELNTAVKPYAIEYLFTHHGLDRVFYFDPDIWLLDSLADLETLLNDSDIILTPHLTSPLPEDGKAPAELDILRAGAYNLGFIGIAGTANTTLFLKWWQRKLYDHCYVDLGRGLFTDQKWIDLVPGLFDRVHIAHNPQFNTAYWNLSHRTVRYVDGRYTVGGSMLCFFHFSGFDPLNPGPVSKHQNRFTLTDIGDARDLALGYASAVLSHGYEQCKHWPYAYATFRNGEPIADYCRRFAADTPEVAARVRDPFSGAGFAEYMAYWTCPVSVGAQSIPRIAYDIYARRPDVQRVYRDISGTDLVPFLNWFLRAAEPDYHLPDHFVAYVRTMLCSRVVAQMEQECPAGSVDALAAREELGVPLGRLLRRVHPPIVLPANAPMASWLAERINEKGAYLPRVAHLVYSDREDLRAAFPELGGRERDTIRFLSWMITYGQREYGFSPEVVNSLESDLNSFGVLRRLPAVQFPLQIATRMLSRPRTSSASTVAAQNRMIATQDDTDFQPRPAITFPAGLNVIGYVRSHTGVGQAGRCTVTAAIAADIPVNVNVFETGDVSKKSDHNGTRTVATGFRYDINLYNVNADQTAVLFSTLDRSVYATRYNIGYWNWEAEDIPDHHLPAFSFLNEVWAPTAFCQDVFSRRSPVPVVRMPYAIEVTEDLTVTRADLSLPADEFLFLTMFDVLSIVARKNPHAVIEAFRAVYRDLAGSRLVLKINNGDRLPEAVADVRAACEGLPVCIIDQGMSRSVVNGLVARCDCLVSLHRSEGYGFALAEAMYLGKPVIATAYSGNMDFTSHDNAFLVDYQLRPVGSGCDPYPETSRWAEPDIRVAAMHMRTVHNQPEVARAVALKGQVFVRENLSPARVGQRIAERLRDIRSRSELRRTSQSAR